MGKKQKERDTSQSKGGDLFTVIFYAQKNVIKKEMLELLLSNGCDVYCQFLS
jgi:hypothetical protein